MAHARYRFNPNAVVTRESNCLRSLEKAIPTLLQNERGKLDFEYEPVSVGYYDVDDVLGEDYKYGLCIGFPLCQQDFMKALFETLQDAYGDQAVRQVLGDVLVGGTPTKDPINTVIVINHKFVPRFLNEICHAVALYNDHYSMVRDFYCIQEGVDHHLFFNNKEIDKEIKYALHHTYQRLHMAYYVSARLQTKLSTMAHSANGAHYLAPLFKKFHHGVSSDVEIYERLNALIHAYHLNEKNDIPGFQNRLEDDAERVRKAEVYENVLTVVHHGDMFYEISDIFKKNPNARLAYVSPDNQFRCGSAALTGNRGSVEEALVRVSDYVPKALQSVALDPRDPQAVLVQLYQQLSPTGGQLRLTSACGIYYLAGQTIPEYVPFAQATAYSEYAYERLHSAREMAKNQLREGACPNYQDGYALQKINPHRVNDVRFLDAQGRVRQVSVVGMVGLDGKRAKPGSVADQIGFDDNHDHDDKGLHDGKFNLTKAIEFYKDQWSKAFESVLYDNHPINVLVLNPVGCGAFDPSKDGHTYTRASAQGFSEAFKEKKAEFLRQGIQVILPIYDMKKVYPHYKEAINHIYDRGIPLVKTGIGGTEALYLAHIRQKYEEMGGKKFDMDGKSLLEVIAHALTKPRKMRDALFALGYLKQDKTDKIMVGDYAPVSVKTAFDAVNDSKHELRVREVIVEEYKHAQGLFHKNKFDIAHTNLEGMIEHGLNKKGNMQKALIKLGYVKPAMVGVSDETVPECVRVKFRQ